MAFTPKKVDIDKIAELAKKSVMAIRDDLEMFKTFDANVGTGIMIDGRKFTEQLMRIQYASTSDLDNTANDTNDLVSPVIPVPLNTPQTPTW